jgi:signal transduction histidine kinase/ligand-binding sensor domain-containing protein/CheY-like chemotaxis protein/AraC-like DNA-binding protein
VRPTIIILLSLLFLPGFTSGEEVLRSDARFEIIDAEDALSSGSVSTIIKDLNGYIWIGTYYGLNRYNGYESFPYYHNSKDPYSLPNNFITSLFQDLSGQLWIGTKDGLCYYDYEKDRFEEVSRVEETYSGKLQNKHIGTVFQGGDDGFYVGIMGGGLYRYSYRRKELVPAIKEMSAEKRQKYRIYSGFYLSEDSVFIGTYGGVLSRYISLSDKIEDYHYPGMEVNCILDAGEDKLLLGTNNMGLYLFDKDSLKYEKVPLFDSFGEPVTIVLGMERDGSDHVLVVTDGAGIIPVDEETKQQIETAETAKRFRTFEKEGVRAVFVEESGIIWIGTVGKGLYKYNPLFNQFLLLTTVNTDANAAFNQNIIEFFQDSKGVVWLGTDGGGLCKMQLDGRKIFDFELYSDLASFKNIDVVRRIFEDEDGDIWLGTYGNGVSVFTPGKESESLRTYYLSSGESNSGDATHVWSLESAGKSRVWAGTLGRGLFRIDKEFGKVESFSDINAELATQLNPYILSMSKDKIDRLWVGTSNGAMRFSSDLKRHSVFLYDSLNNSGVGLNTITDIFHSGDGATWLSTNGGGVVRVSSKDSLRVFNTSNGLSHDKVYSVVQDDNQDYWIATYNGLNRYRPESDELLSLDVRDGLNSSVVQVAKVLSDGYLLSGSPRGLNIFHPQELLLNDEPPKVVFESIFVDNQEIHVGDDSGILNKSIQYTEEIELNADNNSFTVFFSGLNYLMPDKTKYSYRLEGLTEKWSVPTEARWARFNKLPPGDYTLQIKGINNSGVWSVQPATLKFTILPPWYKTRLAFFLFLITFGILIFAYVRYTIFLIDTKRSLAFEKKERLRMEELSEMRSRFFTNISHEFRTPLTLISLPVEKILKQESLAPDLKRELSGVAHNAGYLTRLIDQIMEFSKLESGHLKLELSEASFSKFCVYAVNQFCGLAEGREIELIINDELPHPWVKFDENVIEKVINNLMSNALKYTPKGGRIVFTVFGGATDTSENKPENTNPTIFGNENIIVGFRVEDNGVGIPNYQIDKLFNRYQQFGKPVNEYQQGTGIGLALVKQLIDLHAGSVEVLSDVGRGSTFIVRIAVSLALSHYDTQYVSPVVFNSAAQGFYTSREFDSVNSGKESVDESTVGKKRILIVEDNEELLNHLRNELNASYRIASAHDGVQAIEWLSVHDADLVLSDVIMPRMDGIELCHKIKSNINFSHIPVLLLSARGEADNKIEGLEVGADLYMSKPFDMDLLKAYVRGVITNREKTREYLSSYLFSNNSDENKKDLIEDHFLKKVVLIIKENLGNEYFSVEDLCGSVGMSRSNLHRKLKSVVGKSTTEFIRSFRLKEAAALLTDTDLQISEIAFKVGFSNVSHFIKTFRQEFSLSPSLFRKSQRNNVRELS